MIGLADAMLTRGLAYSAKDAQDEALADFEQALKLYHQQRRPLGVADTRSARARIFLLRGNLPQARDEQAKAITQVERVMQGLRSAQQWATFLRQYAQLYVETAVTDMRSGADEQARARLQAYVRIAGSGELKQFLQEYEEAIPTSGDELSEEELRSNKDLVKRLGQLRKGL